MFSTMLKEQGCSCHEGSAGTNSHPGTKVLIGGSCDANVPAPSRDMLWAEFTPDRTEQGSRGSCSHIPARILIRLHKLCSTSTPD